MSCDSMTVFFCKLKSMSLKFQQTTLAICILLVKNIPYPPQSHPVTCKLRNSVSVKLLGNTCKTFSDI